MTNVNCNLEGLEGAKSYSMPAIFAETPTKAMNNVSKDLACTWASDNGAINIWITNEGKVRVERLVFCEVKESAESENVNELSAFIKRQYRLIR